MSDIVTDHSCRLCGGATTLAFLKTVMYVHEVEYRECESCGCLQTETPFWLAEAYKDARRFTDTFCGVRLLRNQVLTYYLFRILGLGPNDKILDWGGGDGLTTRILRDVGLDAYSFDRYANNFYALGFDGTLKAGFGMITSFEVWEHLREPGLELNDLFAYAPKSVFISTGIYCHQGSSWPYLGAYSGRHIFFYSLNGIAWIAKKYDYDYVAIGNYVVFSRTGLTQLRKKAISLLLGGRFFACLQAWLALRPPKGRAQGDFLSMRAKVEDDK